MQSIPLQTDSDEISFYLGFSKDPNPIHRDAIAARQAALSLMCVGKQTEPALLEKIAFRLGDFVIMPGANIAIKSVGLIAKKHEIGDGYAVRDISLCFKAPMLVPINGSLEMALNVELIEDAADHQRFVYTLTGQSLDGREREYQKAAVTFFKEDSPVWGQGHDQKPAPNRGSALVQERFFYGTPWICPNPSDDPYLRRIGVSNGPALHLPYLLGLIPSALIKTQKALDLNNDYTSMFSNPNKRVVKENENRKAAWEQYYKTFGFKPGNADGNIIAYCSQKLSFVSPIKVTGGRTFCTLNSLYPDGVSKNIGKHVFTNYGVWTQEDSFEIARPYFTGTSDVITLPAYPTKVIEFAIQRHAESLKMGRTPMHLP